MATINPSPSPDTPITIKIALNNGESRRFKLALRDLGAITLPDKLRQLLAIPVTQDVLFERFSDSAGTYVTLDGNNPSVYKQLYRAAKAKLKLRIKVTVADAPSPKVEMAQPEQLSADRLTSHRYAPPMCADVPKTGNAASSKNINSSSVATYSTPAKPRVDLLGTKTQRLRYAYATNAQNDFTKRLSKCCIASLETPKASPEAVTEPDFNATVETCKTADDDEGSPAPGGFSSREHFYAEIANIGRDQPTLLRSADQEFPVPGITFTICCNNCDGAIPDAHWHCSICDDGDFDLCAPCVEKGVLCDTANHWLIKRFVRDGKVINSTTETIAPVKANKVEPEKEVPAALAAENKQDEVPESIMESRTCNSCVQVFIESNFVTCTVCEDYDLCIPCHVSLKHGHHPSHTLEPATKVTTLDTMATNLCAPGRNMRHFAVCDGCDKDIYGVRHKCMNCPDWDYCSSCIKTARQEHPGHHFVPLFEPIQTLPQQRSQRHHGINCDGPLCKGKGCKSYILGDRYKCAVCHDTDFCANCEALPTHRHNRTHPLIKFKSPVKSVSVTTFGEKENGEQMYLMGDHTPQTSSKSTETTPAAKSANAATQVQTIAELKPSEPVKEEVKVSATKLHPVKVESAKTEPDKVEPVKAESVKVELVKAESVKVDPVKVEPVQVEPANTPLPKVEAAKIETLNIPAASELQANFVRDTIADGSVLPPSTRFQQVWTLRNPGPYAWPAGCNVRFIGGDPMFNLDSNHPSSSSDIVKATESNVIGRAVKVGEEVDFAVLMRTPEHEGKGISYWRLKSPDGIPFGHKLWCDITVCVPKRMTPPVPQTSHMEHADGYNNLLSRMIFPKLDKESPVSSTHEAAIVPAAHITEQKDLFEDVESIGLDDDETDDGFLTDEEYELLNASDEELMEARNGKK